MFPRFFALCCLAAVLVGSEVCLGASPAQAKAFGKLPLHFEANHGQVPGRADFVARGNGYSLFVGPTEATFALGGIASQSGSEPHKKSKPLRVKLLGANPDSKVKGREELSGKVNYLVGSDPAQWRTDIPTYRRVRYEEVYPGIDVVYYGNQRELEYDFVVAPGADWRQVSLKFVGADKIELDAATGDLVVRIGEQTIREHKPVLYQEYGGERRAVEGRYVLDKRNRVRFEVGKYDSTLPLVIDPVIVYSTFLGGSETEIGGGIAVDSTGNVYVTGQTDSSDFPLKDPLQSTYSLPFVTKISPDGNAFVYSTYFGTSAADARAIGVDSMGNVYLTGRTASGGIPTANAAQGTFGGGESDAFVTKINASGNAIVYSTYLGGGGSDRANAIAVDGAGNVHVAGTTDSLNFPTVNPRQASNAGYDDVFVTKLSPAGAVIFSTYLGSGDSYDFGSGIAVDPSGDVHVCGTTYSSNFPTLNAVQGTSGGGDEAFVAKFSAVGELRYSTYLGGNDREYGYGIAADSSGNSYVTGITRSVNFPTTPNAFDTTYTGDGATYTFVTKINAAGTGLVYSTYLGKTPLSSSASIAVDSNGAAYVAGNTSSVDFPIVNPLQSTTDATLDSPDGFLTKLNPAGDALVYSTYLGSSGDEFLADVVVDTGGNAYVLGSTNSSDFPTLNPVDGVISDYEIFIMKISGAAGPPTIVKKLANVSTRLSVGTGENVLIGGFIVTGSSPKRIAVRGIGPSLSGFGFGNVLDDPVLDVYRGNDVMATNDNWQQSQKAEIEATGIAPTNDAESMIVLALDPGPYTAIVHGKGSDTGIALVEVYDLQAGTLGSELANISTRGFVQTGSDVMIGGFIVGGGGGASTRVAVRALGPSLSDAGISGALADPILELHNGDGTPDVFNDNWKESQQAEIEASHLAPGHDQESVVIASVRVGNHTVIVRGKDNSTGVGLVEVYNLH